jgi:heme A synthase
LLGAFVVVAAVIWLLKLIRDSESRVRFKVQRILLMAFLTVQLVLGIESWLARFFVPTADMPQLAPLPMHAEWVRTAHYLFGTLIFSTTVAVALVACCKSIPVTAESPARPRELEGVV